MKWLLPSKQDFLNSEQTHICCIISIESSSNSFYLLDTNIKAGSILKSELHLPFTSLKNFCICNLPDNEFFAFTNAMDYSYDFNQENFEERLVFIIDKNREIRILKSTFPSYGASSVYHNGIVYVFCVNYSGEPGEGPEKFIIKENRWVKLPPFPDIPDYSWCCEFFSMILVSSLGNSIVYLYDIYSNSYSDLPLNLSDSSAKLIFKHKEKAYLIETKGNLYESGWKDPYEWKISCKADSPFRNEMVYFVSNTLYNDSWYFSHDKLVYQFKLKNKRLKVFKELNL
ncbi:unnamed protein product [Blepharisma stoltei]|uniref:F-box associated domain-containing protein n=1 Tax=Blepharisma stoltei TaxID=1481888 RepID=A0AAU9J3C7_9CILI|nr:unnamed protein product [Blepharisma stoltei]